MKITIGYLYYDLMNLYGEIGNIDALLYHLKEQNVKVDLKKLSIDDEINFDELDLIYIGMGTEENRDIILKNILKYKKQLKKYIDDNKFVLATGNSFPLFGKQIINKDNKEEKALNIFNFYEEVQTKRIVYDANIKTDIVKDNIYAFANHLHKVVSTKPLFDNNDYQDKNFYGTYLVGPLLVRNPLFCEYFIKKLIMNKDNDFKLKKANYKLNKLAYKEYIIFKQNKKEIK